MFSWEICVVFKSNFFDRTFPMAASVVYVEENTKHNKFGLMISIWGMMGPYNFEANIF